MLKKWQLMLCLILLIHGKGETKEEETAQFRAPLEGAKGALFLPPKKETKPYFKGKRLTYHPASLLPLKKQTDVEEAGIVALSWPFFGSSNGEDFDLNEEKNSSLDKDDDPFPKMNIEFIEDKKEAKGLVASLDEFEETMIKKEPEENLEEEVIQEEILEEKKEDSILNQNKMAYFGEEGQTPFYIDPTLVTNENYEKYVKAMHSKPPMHWIGNTPPPGAEKKPVVNVSYEDALTFAVWNGKRLPTKEELQKAQDRKLLSDEDATFFEWTATASSLPHYGMIFSPTGREIPMRKEAYNAKTGFRLALD